MISRGEVEMSKSQDTSDAALDADDVAGALTTAFQAKNIAFDDDGVGVSKSHGLFHLKVRLSATAAPLPQAPDDDSEVEPGSLEPAALLVLGTVQLVDDMARVTMRVVVVETSEVKETGSGDATGATVDAVESAAEDAIAQLSSLNS